MKSEEENKEVDISEVAISLEVDDEVIQKVRTGEITHLIIEINDENYRLFLENIDGNLVLVVDEAPTTRILLPDAGFPARFRPLAGFAEAPGRAHARVGRLRVLQPQGI